jgi:transmembrane sensor
LAAAAALVVATVLWRPQPLAGPRPGTAVIHPGPEHMALEDGSVVELKAGARVEVQFTPAERRVRLVSGEAHFIVAKNPRRPFIVGANNISVRAVGTAFSVQLGRAAVSVLVTEGKVSLDQAIGGGDESPPRELSPLVAGQQAVVSTDDTAGGPALQIRELTPAEIERALAWQGPRLEFVDMRLSDVVAEFNRYNARKLVVGDRATADILVGGNFRADNVDSFVRLLDVGFGVAAAPHGDEIVLRRRR